jgi:hypothetical protein
MKRPCLVCGALTTGSRCPAHDNRLRGRRGVRLREQVKARQAYRCAACGASCVPLEVHHRDSDPANNALRNLVALCRDCHRKHTNF